MIHLLSASIARLSKELYALQMPKRRCKLKNPTRDKRKVVSIHLLSSEGASLGQSSLSSSWLAEDGRASCADDDGLCVGENGCDCEASWALDVHEERSWCWDQGLVAKSVKSVPKNVH